MTSITININGTEAVIQKDGNEVDVSKTGKKSPKKKNATSVKIEAYAKTADVMVEKKEQREKPQSKEKSKDDTKVIDLTKTEKKGKYKCDENGCHEAFNTKEESRQHRANHAKKRDAEKEKKKKEKEAVVFTKSTPPKPRTTRNSNKPGAVATQTEVAKKDVDTETTGDMYNEIPAENQINDDNLSQEIPAEYQIYDDLSQELDNMVDDVKGVTLDDY